MRNQSKKITTNPLELKIGDKMVMSCCRGTETVKCRLLTNWKREFKESEDRVAFVRLKGGALSLAVVMDDCTDYAELGDGWQDGFSDIKLQTLCAKFGCKPPYLGKGDVVSVWYYATNKKYDCDILKKPFHDVNGEYGEKGDWLLYVKPADMPKAYVSYNITKKRWEFFDGYSSSNFHSLKEYKKMHHA